MSTSQFYSKLKTLSFLWLTSFVLAVTLYFMIDFVNSENSVFARLFRMSNYHNQNPILYISIPCFFYGIISTFLLKYFRNKKTVKNILISLIIAILTIIVSSPFGGMLYFYHDFQAGWFPENWIERMLDSGISSGLMIGWSILIFSLPYSLIGFIVSHLLNIKTSEIIRNNEIN